MARITTTQLAERVAHLEAIVASQADIIASLKAQPSRPASAPAPRARLVAAGDPKQRHPRIYARDAAKALGPDAWVEAHGPDSYSVRWAGQWAKEKISAKELIAHVRAIIAERERQAIPQQQAAA